jgi:hypothetical protein
MDSPSVFDLDAGAEARRVAAEFRALALRFASLDRSVLSPSVLAELALLDDEVRSLVECAAAQDAAALDRSGWLAASKGLRSVPGWVAHERRSKRGPVARSLKLGLALSGMPGTFAAWRAGVITAEHVSLLVLAASGRRKAVFGEHEAELVGMAERFCFDDLVVIVRHWMGLADPDGAAEDSQAAIDARSWKCSETLGMWKIDGVLDPVAGVEYAAELSRLEQLEFEHDVAATRALYGEGVAIMDKLPRTAEQRRADAAVAMARRSRMADHTPVHPAAIIHIEADQATVEAAAQRIADPDAPVTVAPGGVCRIENGPVLSLDDLVELLLVSRVEMIVRDLRTKRVDLGDAQRFFTGAAREAIIRRDGRCTFPGCGLPARRCDIDHLVPWEQGGRTDQANGHAVCRYHHRRKHLGWASAERDPHSHEVRWSWHGPPEVRGRVQDAEQARPPEDVTAAGVGTRRRAPGC